MSYFNKLCWVRSAELPFDFFFYWLIHDLNIFIVIAHRLLSFFFAV